MLSKFNKYLFYFVFCIVIILSLIEIVIFQSFNWSLYSIFFLLYYVSFLFYEDLYEYSFNDISIEKTKEPKIKEIRKIKLERKKPNKIKYIEATIISLFIVLGISFYFGL